MNSNEQRGFRIENVSFAYSGVPVIRGISAEFMPGRFYGLVGPNGSGKTTLLDIMAGSIKPGQGRVFLDGRPLAGYRRRQLALRLALVPQDFSMGFEFTVKETVMMGRNPHIPRFTRPSDEDFRIVEDTMNMLDISGLGDRSVTTLSGGEKQRVAVARALAQKTGILLLDEATASTDIRHSMEILDIARQSVRESGKMVIASIHNLNLAAAFCDEAVIMKSGEIVSSGHSFEALAGETIMDVFGVEGHVFIDQYSKVPQISFRYSGRFR